MEFLQKALSESLHTGFIDQLNQSNAEYLPQIIINDKSVGKKVLTTIDNELKKCEEFWFSVAFVTTNGVATIKNNLIELDKKNIKGKILVSQYLNFSQPEALRQLLMFKNVELKIATKGKFHSKGYLFKKGKVNDLIIGSSNLTSSALCENTEWNLKISATPESYIINNVIKEFTSEFEKAQPVTKEYILKYEPIYKKQFESNKTVNEEINGLSIITPNEMQKEALANLKQIRQQNKNKALLISATGTGKTYLSAFDAKHVNPKKLLFVVHRLNIVKAAMKTFNIVFGGSKSMGIYSGNIKELDNDFIFTTIQTISIVANLNQFDPETFDYIVIDETHRAGAESYQKILNHFRPKFLLGMTATPERTDGLDIFKLFDHTIAYEIRLHKAMEEEMLSPFHYFGVTDITVDGSILDENADFGKLTSRERIDRIIEKAKLYGCDDGNVRGLIFCSTVAECFELSKEFNKRGFKTIALSGVNTEKDRENAINQLESENNTEKIDYIFTVDIFNEGIDIPRVNQIIMLRPTRSAIIFVQQLGRGLRKIDNKDYLTVIDFIGNYNNSYLVPIALYGDTTYNKDTLRKLMASGSSQIPGTSTINFDEISQKRIFESIDTANMQRKKDLDHDFKVLKFKIGRTPMMMDFVEHGSRDPYLYVDYSKSYLNYVLNQENSKELVVNTKQKIILESFSVDINNAKRVEESILLQEIILNQKISIEEFKKIIKNKYGYSISDKTVDSCISNLNLLFVTGNLNNKKVPIGEIHGIKIVKKIDDDIQIENEFKNELQNSIFLAFLNDNINYSIYTFDRLYEKEKYQGGFVLYRKYSRKDVFRILNWKQNPVAQNVGGYIISPDKTNCPIFVNYHKEDSISNSTKYEDGFINNTEFEWMSKSNRTINSPDVKAIINYKLGLRIPLFIKKHNGEGTDFYYMGELTPIDGSFHQTTMDNDKVSVVKIRFLLNHPVEDNLYNYLIHSQQ